MGHREIVVLNGREFEEFGPIAIERDLNGQVVEHSPQSRYSKSATSKLHKYGQGEFCKFKVPGLPRVSGVYLFVAGGELVYVGKAANLRSRLETGYGNISPKNCYKGGQQTNCRINQALLILARAGKDFAIFAHICEDYDELERGLIATLRPPWNRTMR
ncbi:MAG TPA: GIY-YIG nuclease family protein [Fimbriimonadaceae bacterium]|nr:GIY-YIG nuclease family protein [Fimbriimonadaceae bacterium]